MIQYKNIFGPVPSRRLGLSLGIDLVPFKVCSMNCIYCEVGRTEKLTVERKEYIKYDEIVTELDSYLSKNPYLDFVTFSGTGEPTLNNKIGDLVVYLKSNYPQYKLALLTNASLLNDEQVRREIEMFDIILPSLDAVSNKVFIRMNRPHPKLKIGDIIDGLIQLRIEYSNQIWLEIFIVPGINDNYEEISLLKKSVMRIDPDKVQLNSLDRPGTESWLKPLSPEKLKEIVNLFKPINAEIIGKYSSAKKNYLVDNDIEEIVLEALKRRPCTLDDLNYMTGRKINELNKYLFTLCEKGIIKEERKNRGLFYKLIENFN